MLRLFALFLCRLAIVFKGLSRMVVLIFQGCSVRLVLRKTFFQVRNLFFGCMARDRFGLLGLASCIVSLGFRMDARFQLLCSRFRISQLLLQLILYKRAPLSLSA